MICFFEAAFLNLLLLHILRLNFYLVDSVSSLHSDFSLASYEAFLFDFSTFSAAPPGASADPSSFFLCWNLFSCLHSR